MSLTLSVAITLLMLLGFLGLAGKLPEKPRFKGEAVMVDLPPDKDSADVTESASKPAARKPAAAALPPRPAPIVPPPPIAKAEPKSYILLTKQEYENFDLSAPSNVPGRGTIGTHATVSAPDSRPIGTAPDGQPLYEAQWYRHPTDTEMGMYVKSMPPGGGSGLIACKTVARYHVDDCVELGSFPPGSHLASAVRQAAWQFLVRPPRLGGKELVGTWVRIRIDYMVHKEDAPAPSETANASEE